MVRSWVWFGGSYADHLVREGFFSPKQPLHHVGMDVPLLGAYGRLLDQLRSLPPKHPEVMAASVMEILGVAVALSRAAATLLRRR